MGRNPCFLAEIGGIMSKRTKILVLVAMLLVCVSLLWAFFGFKALEIDLNDEVALFMLSIAQAPLFVSVGIGIAVLCGKDKEEK